MLHHLQGLVAGDALDFLRGAASLIQGRCSVLSEAMELDRAKIETGPADRRRNLWLMEGHG